jgi:hypothetical protein
MRGLLRNGERLGSVAHWRLVFAKIIKSRILRGNSEAAVRRIGRKALGRKGFGQSPSVSGATDCAFGCGLFCARCCVPVAEEAVHIRKRRQRRIAETLPVCRGDLNHPPRRAGSGHRARRALKNRGKPVRNARDAILGEEAAFFPRMVRDVKERGRAVWARYSDQLYTIRAGLSMAELSQRRVRNAECGMRSGECGMPAAAGKLISECGVI